MLKSIVLAALFSVASAAISPLQINGTKFFTGTGAQFFIKGVAYQPTSNSTASGTTTSDPLADAAGCAQSVPLIQALGANAIRVYNVNATLNHTTCMNLFANAGIYLFLDLETPDDTIISTSPTWTVTQFNAFAANVDAFAAYPNTAGFFIGNEVINLYNQTDAAPFIKAAARDIKAYIKAKGYRQIPVGYAATDVDVLEYTLAQYLTCGNSSASEVDFYGLNTYRWCGNSTYAQSGYETLTTQYAALGRPVFFSEFGCNTVQPRYFTEVQALYGANMTPVWSGGIVYEWVEEVNNYGLVTSASAGASPTPLADYTRLSIQWASVSPSSTALSNYAATTSSITCPSMTSGFIGNTVLPPTPDEGFCSCEAAAAKCSAAPAATGSSIASAYAYLCGLSSGQYCAIVDTNGTSGQYGQYSFCVGNEQLALAFQNYYSAQSSSSSACSFGGLATLVATPKSAATCVHQAYAVLASGVTGAVATATAAASGAAATSGAKTTTAAAATASTTSTTTAKSAGQISSQVTLTVLGLVSGMLAFIMS